MKTSNAGQLRPRPLDDETIVHCSRTFSMDDSQACCLRLPCLRLRDQVLIQSRILANIADHIKNM